MTVCTAVSHNLRRQKNKNKNTDNLSRDYHQDYNVNLQTMTLQRSAVVTLGNGLFCTIWRRHYWRETLTEELGSPLHEDRAEPPDTEPFDGV